LCVTKEREITPQKNHQTLRSGVGKGREKRAIFLSSPSQLHRKRKVEGSPKVREERMLFFGRGGGRGGEATINDSLPISLRTARKRGDKEKGKEGGHFFIRKEKK